MIDFSDKNKQNIKHHLKSFYDCVTSEHNKGLTVDEIADNYIDNEAAMQKGMKEYYDYLKKESDQNNALLSTIKQQKGKTFFKYLMEIINNSDGIKGAAEIIKEPIGDFQKESYGRQIKGIWVDQRSVGDSGDSWEGTVCVQLGESRYFKFGYSM